MAFPKLWVVVTLVGLLFSVSYGHSEPLENADQPIMFPVRMGDRIIPTRLPMVFPDTDALMVLNSAHLGESTRLLSPYHLFPVPVGGKAVVLLIAAEHASSSLTYNQNPTGKYRELIIGIFASKRKLGDWEGISELAKASSMNPFGPSKEVFLFMLKIYVTDELALEAGIQAYGLPKARGFVGPWNNTDMWTFQGFVTGSKEPDDKFRLFVQWRPYLIVPTPVGYMDITCLSPNRNQIHFQFKTNGVTKIGLFRDDFFELADNVPSEIADTLRRLRVTPVVLGASRGQSGIVGKPYIPGE